MGARLQPAHAALQLIALALDPRELLLLGADLRFPLLLCLNR